HRVDKTWRNDGSALTVDHVGGRKEWRKEWGEMGAFRGRSARRANPELAKKDWKKRGFLTMVRIGIVGVGFMGMIHYLAAQKLRGARVAAIHTRDPKKLA